MFLHDSSTGETIYLNEMFERDMGAKSGTAQFTVGDSSFCILHVRLYSAHIKDHLIHYCANDRVVVSEKLAGHIPNLIRRLQDESGREFVYAAYIESNVLDSTVNAERTAFSIAADSDSLLKEDITWTSIQDAVRNQCRSFLSPYTDPILKQKLQRIDDFVARDAPMYRPVMKHISEKVEMIDPEASDNDLDIHLYEAYQSLQLKVKTEGARLLQQEVVGEEDFEDYKKRFSEYFDKVTDINAADLARYVCHRKAILDFLHKQLSIQTSGKYSKEERVHNIIFPRGQTSEDVLPNAHNLWLIDEKLVYHKFLASDKQLKSIDTINCPSQKEPDIIVFDKACAFAPSEDPPFPAIVIVEFKRPMRNNYTEEKNPFIQVREYIEAIRGGKARTPDGREVPVPANIPFYCYVICDPTETLVRQAKDFELEQTPDGLGFFGFKRHYQAYFEVISYTKMVTDAKKRNAVLFNTLGLPSRIS